MAVVRGGADTGLPAASAAAVKPAISPEAAGPPAPSTADLRPPENQRRFPASLPRFGEHRRAVHVSVAVHHPVAHELRLLEARNQPQHARLVAPFDLRLEPDQAEMIAPAGVPPP